MKSKLLTCSHFALATSFPFIKKLFVVLVMLVAMNASGQWFWQNPLPQGNTLKAIKFVDSNTGYAVGDYGTIIKTTNGGINWEVQVSGTFNFLYATHFFDSQTGWVVRNQKILKTTNGGVNWIPKMIGGGGFFMMFISSIHKQGGLLATVVLLVKR